MALILDFVPNHVAPDHEWTTTHPEWFVRGTPEEIAADPAAFLAIGDAVIARGRDPYFPPWPDVAQLDASLPALRAAAAAEVAAIAERCDGVRCDMAMLVLDDIFVRTWGDRAAGGPAPDGGRGYWPTVMAAVREAHPDFVFWAEAYWDLEPRLLEAGFDACYDKRLYDRLVHGEPAASIRAHLGADVGYQVHTVRFVENHDEPRLAATLPAPAARAAAVVALTLPGVALLHEGQEVGRRVRVPVTLGRRPDEAPDVELAEWYGRLRTVLDAGLRRGEWTLVAAEGWPDNQSCDHLVAWTWIGPDRPVPRRGQPVRRQGRRTGAAGGVGGTGGAHRCADRRALPAGRGGSGQRRPVRGPRAAWRARPHVVTTAQIRELSGSRHP